MARSVTDRHGIVWNVEEVPRASGRRRPAAGVARWLSCVSAGAWRQLRDFPADWRELPEPELASLLERAERADSGDQRPRDPLR
ncbi:MAG: hypothetical protein WKG32_03785 [Gemmatimonadaceae bacterium]